MGDQTQHVAVDAEDRGVACLTQPGRARGHRREYRLDISGRAGYHTQDFARRGLLLKRFGDLRMSLRERTVLVLKFREQTDILDGDDRLVRKGLEQSDLLVREGAHLASPDEDCPNGDALTEERSAEHRAPPEPPGEDSADRKVVGLGQIFDVDDPRLADRVSGYRAKHRLASADLPGERTVVSTKDKLVTVDGPQHGIDGTTYDARSTHDRVENRLVVGR